MKEIFLSIIIPAYNEAERIVPTLLSIDEYLSSTGIDRDLSLQSDLSAPQIPSWEIIVVDDGSQDKTAEIVEKLSKGPIKNLKIVSYGENKGKGSAVAFGMLYASGKIRIFMDADNSTKINEIEKFLPYFQKGFNVVIGSRALPDSKILIYQPFYKKIMGRIGGLFVRLILGLKIKDTQCGFKAFSGKATENIFSHLTTNVIFDAEILVLANFFGYKIKEVGIEWTDDADSRFGAISYLKALKELTKIKWNLIRKKYNQQKDD